MKYKNTYLGIANINIDDDEGNILEIKLLVNNGQNEINLEDIHIISNEFSDLTSLRKEQGISVTKIGAKIGSQAGNLTNLETGTRKNPTLKTMRSYVDALGYELYFVAVKK